MRRGCVGVLGTLGALVTLAVSPVPVQAGPVPDAAATAPAPALTLNGSIVFEGIGPSDSHSRIYRLDGDGTGATPLTTSLVASEPSFSPSGREIAFSGYDGPARKIYVMNADGTGAEDISPTGGSHHDPAWSPDGEEVAYADEPHYLGLASYDGGGQGVFYLPTGVADPSYSPDGRYVIFTSSTEDHLKEAIYRMDAATGALVRLDWTETFRIDDPVYSPDGRFILYGGSSPQGAGVVRVAADGTGSPVLLAPDGAEPAFSPDGMFILFTGVGQTLWRMTADGGSPVNLTPPGLFVQSPSWGLLPCGGLEPTVLGTGGPDHLVGTPGPDVIEGLRGPDFIDGGGGADVICGGLGPDTVSYADHELDVTVDLDGVSGDDGSAEDGPPGLRDTVAGDVEHVVGGYGDDVLTGGSGANTLTGGPGDDALSGVGGVDTLTGSSGDDVLVGGDGNDRLFGLTGLDGLDGGGGQDSLDGGNDADSLDGGAGIDTATYATRTTGVVVTLGAGLGDDGNAVDGPVGYRDTVALTVERLIGGRGNDSLVGSAGDNRLTGGLGADRLRGLGGVDTLLAADGVADLLIDCGAGTDVTAVVDAGLDPAPVSCP
jgi:Ca2+-binding RTX toxin-like protein